MKRIFYIVLSTVLFSVLLISCGNSNVKNASQETKTEASTAKEITEEPKSEDTPKSVYLKTNLEKLLKNSLKCIEEGAIVQKPKKEMIKELDQYVTNDFQNSEIRALYCYTDEAQRHKPDAMIYDQYGDWNYYKNSPELYQEISKHSKIGIVLLNTDLPNQIDENQNTLKATANFKVDFMNDSGVSENKNIYTNNFVVTANYKFKEVGAYWQLDSYNIESLDGTKRNINGYFNKRY
ncbi:hypothetical protein [Clostridium sp. C2-6-12]|uniref:hypothetical protein n=1 Tax=Clostridium sp. C2-6-12 TaxID=2698832 RepID=UPI0013706589|nr:hypothetical protein [Clostridium sp. C2-6-12]